MPTTLWSVVKTNVREIFELEGSAFQATTEARDDLVRINRFRDRDNSGYLYASEEESVAIREGFPELVEEGIAFYSFAGDLQQNNNIFRFRSDAGQYILVNAQERQSIIDNGGFGFTEEGLVFNAIA